MPGKVLNSQAQKIILCVFEFFQQEKNANAPIIPFSALFHQLSAAVQLPESTLHRIVQRNSESQPGPSTPKKNKIRAGEGKVQKLDTFSKDAIRRTIYEMRENSLHITMNLLYDKLKEKGIYEYSKTSLYRLIKSMGFRFKVEDNRKYLCEKSDVVLKQISFLRSYKKFKDEGYFNENFLDETWIFGKGSERRLWTDDTSRCIRHKSGTGKRFIVVHAGGRNGFVEGASLVFASSSTTGDYHGDMNAEKFEKWLEEDMLPKLNEPSLIILDNASYHSRQIEKQPTTSWTRAQLLSFLEEKNVPVEGNLLRLELLHLARQHAGEKRFVVDEIINRHGHQVLRLPPYHCEYNPIEHVCAQCKTYYDNNIGRDGFGDRETLAMWEEALSNVSTENWQNYVRGAEKLILDDCAKYLSIDSTSQQLPVIIHLGYDSDSDFEENEDDDYEDL